MSFATIATLLPQIIQIVDALDDVVITAVDSMGDEDLDPAVSADLEQMLAEKQASAAKRDAALDRLRVAIEKKRAVG